MASKTVAIIGAGRVGSAVGFLLKKAGYSVTGVVARTLASAEQAAAFIGAGIPTADAVKAASQADIVFITTPDRAIRIVCETLAADRALRAGSIVVHTSGAHTLDLLDAAKTCGAYRAVLHPLQSLASREEGVRNLPGSYFRIEADPDAIEPAKAVVEALGGTELAMPNWHSDSESAALYHAGAVAVSNFFVALIDYGLKFYEALGADRKQALKAVLPLVKGTLHNVETLGIPDALTGPIMRGDIETVKQHLAAMRKRTPHLVNLYRALAQQTVSVAREKGSITVETEEELLKQLR